MEKDSVVAFIDVLGFKEVIVIVRSIDLAEVVRVLE